MKIALVAPLMVTVPPKKYGGIECIVDELAQGLAKRGHTVSVFCAGGSTITGKNIQRIETTPYPTQAHAEENQMREYEQFNTILKQQDDFDIIHFHFEPMVFRVDQGKDKSNLLDALKKPAVCTFHNVTTIPENRAYYRKTTALYRHTMVFISENQRSHVPFFPNTQVIYNGLPLEKFSVEEHKEGYLLFLGRITPSKGILEAITVAEKTGIPLVIAAKVDPVDQIFYEQHVKSRIDGQLIRYVGEVDFKEKTNYLGKARALLFPILWEEPFGLVMVEALACGTPVIAFQRGSVPEIIQDGVNGYVVNNVDEMVDAVPLLEKISPRACRESVEPRFSAERMVSEYEALFLKKAGLFIEKISS